MSSDFFLNNKHSPAIFSRKATGSTEVTLKTSKYKFVIPVDTDVIAFPWITHRFKNYDDTITPTNDDDLGIFDPERTIRKTDPYFPFAMGSRNCVGRELAMAEVRASIAYIVHTYDFEPPTEDVVTYLKVTLNPNQCKMKFKRR